MQIFQGVLFDQKLLFLRCIKKFRFDASGVFFRYLRVFEKNYDKSNPRCTNLIFFFNDKL